MGECELQTFSSQGKGLKRRRSKKTRNVTEVCQNTGFEKKGEEGSQDRKGLNAGSQGKGVKSHGSHSPGEKRMGSHWDYAGTEHYNHTVCG